MRLELALFAIGIACISPRATGAQFDIVGPPGSVAFGTHVAALPNGNIIVTDPMFPGPPGFRAGAVYLFGPSGTLISTLTGSTSNDRVGNGGLTLLSNGHVVARSRFWSNGTSASSAGAVTWINGTTGRAGTVSASNSLVGSRPNDNVGGGGIIALSNGHYVVRSPDWNTATVARAGAATWGNGSTGAVVGAVAAGNSLVGSADDDEVGFGGVVALGNGNYIVLSPRWDMGAIEDAGAATWCNGATGRTNTISIANSLVGSRAFDSVGDIDLGGVYELANGNAVLASPFLDTATAVDAGSVTWINGASGRVGAVGAANSLLGASAGDLAGSGGVASLSNGHYVVVSEDWDNAAVANVGAVTWGNGASGLVATISTTNSLIGATAEDRIGSAGATALSNGHYVVASPLWDSGLSADIGAVTWANGGAPRTGSVSAANSLTGALLFDRIGSEGVIALSNGHYVVRSPFWNNIATNTVDVGAATWAIGTSATTGMVSASNSTIGSTAGDLVGSGDVLALGNGNYVVVSPLWDNTGAGDAGAATWRNGAATGSGVVGPSNSLVGSTAGDLVGFSEGLVSAVALSDGNYAIGASSWNNGAISDAGAVTWGSGTAGVAGPVSAANSLFGARAGDRVGDVGVFAQTDGRYVVQSAQWMEGAIAQAGAVTLALGNVATTGTVTSANSVRGSVASSGSSLVFDYDTPRARLVVGRRTSNVVTVLTLVTEAIFANGFE